MTNDFPEKNSQPSSFVLYVHSHISVLGVNVQPAIISLRHVLCAVAILLIDVTLIAQEHSLPIPALDPPYKTILFSSPAPQGATVPFFNHGYVIQFKHLTKVKGESNIYLYNSLGKLEHEIAIWPHEATSVFLTSVDVSINSKLALAGQTTKDDGSKYNFVVTCDLDGKGAKYINTGSYLATQITRAEDGSVWSVGAERLGGDSLTSWQNYDALRHYRVNGSIGEHFLPRWGAETAYVTQIGDDLSNVRIAAYGEHRQLLATYGPPAWGPTIGYIEAWKFTSSTFIRATDTGVVLYDGSNHYLYQYEYSSSLPIRSSVGGDFQSMVLSGFAVSPDGHFYGSMTNRMGGITAVRGLFELVSEGSNEAMRWVPIPGTVNSERQGIFKQLLGIDGRDLVYLGWETSSLGTKVLWSNR